MQQHIISARYSHRSTLILFVVVVFIGFDHQGTFLLQALLYYVLDIYIFIYNKYKVLLLLLLCVLQHCCAFGIAYKMLCSVQDYNSINTADIAERQYQPLLSSIYWDKRHQDECCIQEYKVLLYIYKKTKQKHCLL